MHLLIGEKGMRGNGYGPEAIQYLSSDTDLDIDGNDVPDVDADATNASDPILYNADGTSKAVVYPLTTNGWMTKKMLI